MKVCIAEKPSVARELAHVLGAKTKKQGYFEGNGYQITWTFGHLCELKEPDDYYPELKRWQMVHLPIIPNKFGIKLKDDNGIQQQFKTIENLIKGASEVINCGDAGQEGELIQRWVLMKAGCKAPIKRLWISSLTTEAIRDGFTQLYDSKDFDNLYYAGNMRAIGDWLLGINATRLFTLKFGGRGQVLSVGRVQTPTLALVVNRCLEIDNFKPEPYWEIKTNYREVTFNSTKGRYTNKEEALKAAESIKGAPFTIKSFKIKKGKELPPQLFDLTSLQVECNKKFGMTADQTLKTIQNLYEKKLVSYPRVDTTFLPNDIYPKVAGIMQSMKAYSQFTQPLLAKKIKKPKKVFNDQKVTDHHAIIPTNVTASGLMTAEQNVYGIIAKRFIAAFSDDCIISRTEVLGDVNKLGFKATGKQILTPGWRDVYANEKQEKSAKDKDEEQTMPEFKEGESGPHKPDLLQKETNPPKLYTEATLLRAMETAGKQVDDEELSALMKENGIGRPSTRASIIETLFRRKYLQRQKKNIIATETGIQLIKTINNELLKSAELTGQWEKKLRDIENGEYEVQTFMEELKGMVTGVVKEVRQTSNVVRFDAIEEKEPTISADSSKKAPASNPCPKCQKGEVIKGKSAYGCSNFKACDFRLPFEFMGKKLTDKQVETLVLKGKTGNLKGFEQNGEKVEGKLILDDNKQLTLEPKEVKQQTPEDLVGKPCPKCKKGTVVKGKTAYGCSNYQECDFRVSL